MLALPTANRVFLSAESNMFFVGTDSGPLRAFSLAGGWPAWTSDRKPDLPPVTGDNLLFVAQGDLMYAIDQATGQDRWTAATGPLAVAPTWQPGWLFTSAKDGSIAAWRVSDGSQVWRQAIGSPASARMTVDGERLFVGLADQRFVALRILPDGQPLWSITLNGVAGEPLAAADRLYFGTSTYGFFCVKQANGQFDWPPHRGIHSTVVGHPVMDDERLWIATLNNRLAALLRSTGEIDWTVALPSRPSAQLVIDRGEVVVPLESGELFLFNQKDGKRVRPPPPAAAPVAAAPAPDVAAATGESSPSLSGTAARPVIPFYPSQSSPPGTRMAAPLVAAGPPDARRFLRITLGADDVHTATLFERAGRCALAFLACQVFK